MFAVAQVFHQVDPSVSYEAVRACQPELKLQLAVSGGSRGVYEASSTGHDSGSDVFCPTCFLSRLSLCFSCDSDETSVSSDD